MWLSATKCLLNSERCLGAGLEPSGLMFKLVWGVATRGAWYYESHAGGAALET